jgi:putative ABC transport system permease protein
MQWPLMYTTWMNLTRLALRDISGNAFRSGVIVICALLVAGLSLATVLIARGADDSLRLTQQRLGADIMVVPRGTEQKVEGALLMGSPMKAWLPEADVKKIAAVPGVAAASPQLYLASIVDTPYSTVSPMFVVAYDPATDFTIGPWLKSEIGRDVELGLGESVGGTFVLAPPGEATISLFGYDLDLVANLEPTGTSLDQTVFVSLPGLQEQRGVTIPDDGVSSVMVKIAPGADPKKVSAAIQASVPGVTAVNSPDLFGSFRTQMEDQRTGVTAVLGVVLALSVFIIGVVFSVVVNERRREIGVLRALGATRGAVLRSLLTGAAVLALGGGVAGIIFSGLVLFVFRHKLVGLFGFPFLFPSLPRLLALVVIGLAVALATVMLAAFIPAYRISRQEPAVSMRE